MKMVQIIVSLFFIGFSLPLSARLGTLDKNPTGDRDPIQPGLTLSNKITVAKDQIARKDFSRSECYRELNNINNNLNIIKQHQNSMDGPQYHSEVNQANNQNQTQLRNCYQRLTTAINNERHPFSRSYWYNQHLAGGEYKKDFKRYPELAKQFNSRIYPAYQNMDQFLQRTRGIGRESIFRKIEVYTEYHPHLQDHTLPDQYNTMLKQLKQAKGCTIEKTESCHANLERQLAEDSKDSLKAVCQKALREAQVCCSNPNRNCGDFAFAKDITRTFAQNLPALSQAYAKLQAVKGNTAEACKLSQLGPMMGSLGNLQTNSCNAAIKGCRETCQAKLDKFIQDFKTCYKVGQQENLREVIQKVTQGIQDKYDPRFQCQENIKKLAEAYKQSSLENRYSLSEDSDHEEMVACHREVARYAPGGASARGGARHGGMNPTEELAVNMCYNQLDGGNPYAGGGPQMTPPSTPVTVGGFAGGRGQGIKPPGSRFNEDGNPHAGLEGDDDYDFLPTNQGQQMEDNNVKFQGPGGSGGGPSGSGAMAGGGASPGGSDGGDGAGKRGTAGSGDGKQLPFYTGDSKQGENNGDSWGAEWDAKYLRHKRKAEALKKLPARLLTPDEKDLVKMYSWPSKHESIFERATFAFHWFCRNYGCLGYNEAMGIEYPDIDPYSFLDFPKSHDLSAHKGLCPLVSI